MVQLAPAACRGRVGEAPGGADAEVNLAIAATLPPRKHSSPSALIEDLHDFLELHPCARRAREYPGIQLDNLLMSTADPAQRVVELRKRVVEPHRLQKLEIARVERPV